MRYLILLLSCLIYSMVISGQDNARANKDYALFFAVDDYGKVNELQYFARNARYAANERPTTTPDSIPIPPIKKAIDVIDEKQYFPEIEDFRQYKDTLELRTVVFQRWLENQAIGKVLRFRELGVEEQYVSLYLEFLTDDLSLQIAGWRALKEHYDGKGRKPLEEVLFNAASNIFRLRKSILDVQAYDNYDLQRFVFFRRAIFYEDLEMKIEASRPVMPVIEKSIMDSIKTTFQF